VTGADADGRALLAGEAEDAALHRAVQRWRVRLGEIPSTGRLAAWQESGLRLVMPGDAEWPTQLDDLGDTRPLLLWARGSADLRLTCVNSVAIVGSRAAHRVRQPRCRRDGRGPRRKRRRAGFRRRLRYENPTVLTWLSGDAERPLVPKVVPCPSAYSCAVRHPIDFCRP
jgi:DNA recombination-mediator protein A